MFREQSDCDESNSTGNPGAAEILDGIEATRVTAPNGGEIFHRAVAPATAITWITNGTIKPVTKVTLSYSTNGGGRWTKIKDVTNNPGSYAWTFPGTNSQQYRVKVELFNGSTRLGDDTSDGNFEVKP